MRRQLQIEPQQKRELKKSRIEREKKRNQRKMLLMQIN
jgi:hypothetical protein